MTINKSSIDENYTYINTGYIDIVIASLAKMSATGFRDKNLSRDIMSLNHYLFVISEFDKYYEYLVHQLIDNKYIYLQAPDVDINSYLISSDNYFLISINPDLDDNNEENSIVGTDINIQIDTVNQYIQAVKAATNIIYKYNNKNRYLNR